LASTNGAFGSKMAFAVALIILIGLASSQATQDRLLYEKDGWQIFGNDSDINVKQKMEIVLDGVSQGDMIRATVKHRSKNSGFPEVAVIYASGYIKLKQNADPKPYLRFGGSFVLGPAYNGTNDTSEAYMYNNSPQLDRLEINTSLLPKSPLIMKAFGLNRDFRVVYEMQMPTPTDELTSLHVNQTYVAKENITISQFSRQKHEGFKIVQFSSMFINEGGKCKNASCHDVNAAPETDCHDSNAARYLGEVLIEKAFRNLTLSNFMFDNPTPMTQLWLDLLHTDNESWQGNTPNLRIQLDDQYDGAIFVPQGWIQDDDCPSNDNVGLWIHDDGAASMNWSKGQEGRISYRLLALDNPPDLSNFTASI